MAVQIGLTKNTLLLIFTLKFDKKIYSFTGPFEYDLLITL